MSKSELLPPQPDKVQNGVTKKADEPVACCKGLFSRCGSCADSALLFALHACRNQLRKASLRVFVHSVRLLVFTQFSTRAGACALQPV